MLLVLKINPPQENVVTKDFEFATPYEFTFSIFLKPLGFTKKVAEKKLEQVLKNYVGDVTVEDLVRKSLG